MSRRASPQEPESWTQTASAYEELFFPFSRRVAAEAVSRLDVARGERFLDVAAGTGAATERAAAAGARVTAIDFSKGMLEILGGKVPGFGPGSVELLQMDGQDLELPDDSFDVGGSSLGLIFFPDPGRGLGELRRVLCPGGRAYVTSLEAQPPARLMQLVMGAVFAAVPDFRPTTPPAQFHYASAHSMASALEAAGFSDVRVERVPVQWPLADPETFWKGWALASPPTAGMMSELSAAQQAEAGKRFIQLARTTPDGGPATFESTVILGLGLA